MRLDPLGPALQELTFLEYFAGEGNCWRALMESGQPAAGIDIEYYKDPRGPDEQNNPFDMLSSAGLASGTQLCTKFHTAL